MLLKLKAPRCEILTEKVAVFFTFYYFGKFFNLINNFLNVSQSTLDHIVFWITQNKEQFLESAKFTKTPHKPNF